jgi:hypothetical protein
MTLCWVVSMIIALVMATVLIVNRAQSEWCQPKPGPDQTPQRDSRSWRWRMVDGRKCWFYSDRRLPKEDLVWEYDINEFNEPAEGGVAGRERKFYSPEQLQEMRR